MAFQWDVQQLLAEQDQLGCVIAGASSTSESKNGRTPGRSAETQRGLGCMVLLECPVINLPEGCWQFFLFSIALLFLIIVYNCVFVLPACLLNGWALQFTLVVILQVSPTCNKSFPLRKAMGWAEVFCGCFRKCMAPLLGPGP